MLGMRYPIDSETWAVRGLGFEYAWDATFSLKARFGESTSLRTASGNEGIFHLLAII